MNITYSFLTLQEKSIIYAYILAYMLYEAIVFVYFKTRSRTHK